jgi:hypothetical protein
VQFQWRGYRWNGSAFTQISGPTKFPPNKKVNDLSVTTTDLVFGPPVDGVRHGSMTVTAREAGPARFPYKLTVSVPAGLQLVAPACKVETFPQPVVNVTCDETGPVTVTFQFTATTAVTPNFYPEVGVHADNTKYGDPDETNNSAPFSVKY